MIDKQLKPDSDEELMLRYARGDTDAFQTLYEHHRGGLYRYFLRQSNSSVAEELFQDVWAQVIKSRKRYRAKAAFRTWLYTLAHNRLIDHWRREGRSPLESGRDESMRELAADENPGPQRLADLRDCIEQLLALISSLPDVQQQTFLLRHEAGMSLSEIAEVMTTGAETAKSRLRYAMERLRSAIAQECLEG
jgi:RNA polymerase sigma-70 factor (ECF subfamily)